MKNVVPGKFLWPLLAMAGMVSPLVGQAEEANAVAREVVVTATRVRNSLQDVPASISVVTEEDIQRNGYTSVADMLQDVPGVQVYDQGVAGVKRATVRGESGERTLILVDGQKISEQKSMDGAPLLMDANTVARIEVMKGPASVLYGSEAIGGVINIITKKGGSQPIGGDVSITYNSSTRGFEENVAVHGAKDGYYYRLSGTYSDQDNRKTPSGKLDGSNYMARSFNASLGYEDHKIAFGANAEKYYSEADIPAIPNYPMPGGRFDLNLPEWSREKVGGFVDLKNINNTLAKIHVDAYAQKTVKDFEQNMHMPLPPMLPSGSDLSIKTYNDQKSYALNAQIDLAPSSDHYMIAGASLSRDTLDATTNSSGTGIYTAAPSYNYRYAYDASINTYALYIQDQWKLPQSLELTVGGRQTWVESALKRSNDPMALTGNVKDNHPVFSAGLVWKGTKDLTLRSLLSQGYRFPDLNKLYMGTAHGGQVTNPNRDLKPETSNNMEIGARYNTHVWTVDVAAFASRAKDYISTRLVLAPSVYEFANVDKAMTYGVEAMASYKIARYNLTPYVSATFMRRKYEESGSSTWNTNTPTLSGRMGVKYARGLNGKESLWADLYVRAATDADYVDAGAIKTNSAWQTLNLGVGTSFGNREQYRLSMHLGNILNQTYHTAQNSSHSTQSSLDEAGRHVVVRLSVLF